MRICSRSWAGFWKNDRAVVCAVRTIQYNNSLFYLLFLILYNIYNLLFIRLAVVTHNWISLPCRQGVVEGKVRIRTANFFFRLRNRQKLVRIWFGCGLDLRIYGNRLKTSSHKTAIWYCLQLLAANMFKPYISVTFHYCLATLKVSVHYVLKMLTLFNFLIRMKW